jgi:hypothetical protein
MKAALSSEKLVRISEITSLVTAEGNDLVSQTQSTTAVD